MDQGASLQIEGPTGERSELALDATALTIGRDASAGLQLESGYVSRLHATVEPAAEGYLVRDEGSRNGTFINGQRLTGERLLADGDEIKIGEHRLFFSARAEGETALTMVMPALSASPITCDQRTHELRVRGERVDVALSSQEFQLLSLLSERYGRIATRDELGVAIWGSGNYEYNMLHRLVHRLKAKLDAVAPDAIASVSGVGYRLEIAAGAAPPPAPRAAHASDAAHDGMAVIFFSDIVDSTALTERLGDHEFRARARKLDAAMRACIRGAGGVPVEGKLLGDGVLAVFSSARGAIEAALACRDAGEAAELQLHLGLHAGDVIREGDNVYGGAVNIASRVCGLSAPGEVLVTDIVRGLARTSTRSEFEDRGQHQLKGLSEEVRVFRLA